jgi:hypothetical protein
VLAWWFAFNLAAELLRSRATRYLLVRYEDFARDPKRVLAAITRDCCGTEAEVSFVEADGRARICRQHDVAGNPDKLTDGEIVIRERQWRLPPGLRLPLSVLSYPMRRRYDKRSRLKGPFSEQASGA